MVPGTPSPLTHRIRVVLLAALLGLGSNLRADHFSGASITYDCVGVNQYKVMLDLYLNCSGVPVTTQTINFSNDCGVSFSMTGLTQVSATEVSPLCPGQLANSACNGGTLPSFKKYRFQTTLFLSPCNKWKFEWYTCCRNNTVNISLAPGTYAVATLDNLSGICDDSPVFVDSGIPYVCVNQQVAYNPGVSDPEGNLMSFALITARYGSPTPTDVTYQSGFSGAAPIPGLALNPVTGQITFVPTITGYYVVVFEVTTRTSGGVVIGTVMRDLMFAVIACDGNPPTSQGVTSGSSGLTYIAGAVYACNGLPFCFTVPFNDLQAGTNITVTSNATSVLPGATLNVTGTNPASATICWTGNETLLPLFLWLQASDNACPIANTMSLSITALNCSTLPVELLGLEAIDAGDHVLTRWSTSSETSSESFTVERSADGAFFADIGSVAAAGNSLLTRDYSFADRAPLRGTSYYRLRQIDQDGTNRITTVVSVTRILEPTITASTLDHQVWLVHGGVPGSEWSLFDLHGSLVANGTFTDASGEPVSISCNIDQLHLLRVQNNAQVSVLKLPPGEPGEQATVRASAD